MKRVSLPAICMICAFAVSAVAAAGASAAAPEYGRCKAMTKGAFLDSKCTKKATGTKVGKYEWFPGAEKAKFTSSGGVGVLTTVGGSGVECQKESSAGEFLPGSNKEEAGVIVKFTGCKSLGLACTTPGAESGELVTNELDGLVGWENKAKKKTALELYPALSVTSGLFIEFSCGGLVVKVQGHVLVPIKNDIMTKTENLKFVAAKGKQKPEKWENQSGPLETAILEASFKGGPFEQAGQQIATVVTGEEELELNAVV